MKVKWFNVEIDMAALSLRAENDFYNSGIARVIAEGKCGFTFLLRNVKNGQTEEWSVDHSYGDWELDTVWYLTAGGNKTTYNPTTKELLYEGRRHGMDLYYIVGDFDLIEVEYEYLETRCPDASPFASGLPDPYDDLSSFDRVNISHGSR